MIVRGWVVGVAFVMAASSARAGSPEIKYGPVPAWVAPSPEPSKSETPDGAPLRIIYNDRQIWLGPDGDENFTSYRVKILKPEALALGNISAAWNPNSDDITVHALKIRRADRVIDVLATAKFQVIQRENNLDYAMLNGDLTATLQTPGLQVGDELEFAVTIRRRDPTFGERSTGVAQLPLVGLPGVQRVRIFWPDGKAMRWRASADLGAIAPVERNGRRELSYELRDATSAIVADGAPARVNVRRRLEYSAFGAWSEISSLIGPLFDQAAKVSPTSPIREEAAKIASSTNDPALRAEAALKLVQDRIRYVYVGLDGGNYRPASAEDTWSRRFGDCKAKTVLLMALLHELGIPSEAVLVNSAGGDGTDSLLPTPGAFDHVLVRAKIGSKTYWLDGTRLGDRLATLPPPVFRWALPLVANANLEAIGVSPPSLPQSSIVLDVDASAGFASPAKVTAEQVMRGDGVVQLRSQLSALSPEDAERGVKAFWRTQYAWVEPSAVTWRFDELQNAMIFTLTGQGKPDWEGDDVNGRSLDIYSAGFTPPNETHRPSEQDQTAPWLTEFPTFRRFTTVIRLPAATPKWRWGYFAAPVDEKLGGVSYWRRARLENDVIQTTMSRRVYQPEITAAQAKAINDRLPNFNNKISRVFQQDASSETSSADTAIAKAEAEAGKDPKRLTALGNYHLGVANYPRALRAFDRALGVDPANAPAIVGKANALMRSKDVATALRFLDASKQKADLQVQLFHTALLMQASRLDEARTLMQGLAAQHPDNVEVMVWLAQAEYNAGAVEQALADADAAVASAPDSDWPRRTRALIRFRAGRYQQAFEDYDALLQQAPEDSLNFRSRSAALLKLGRPAEALADIDEAMRIDPLDTSSLAVKAKALRTMGRAQEAASLFEPWIARSKTGSALNARCWDRAIANVELAEAEADCAAAIKLSPASYAVWDSYAFVALRAGRLDEAIKRYDHALSLNKNGPTSLYGRGVAKLRAGDKVGGQADLAAAKALGPNAGAELAEAGVAPPNG